MMGQVVESSVVMKQVRQEVACYKCKDMMGTYTMPTY